MLDYIRVDHFLLSPFNRIQIIMNRDMQRVVAFDNDPSYNISKKVVGVSNIKLSSNIWSTFTWLMDFTLHLFSQATKQALIHRPAAFLRQVSRELQAASKIYPVGKLLVIAMRLLHFLPSPLLFLLYWFLHPRYPLRRDPTKMTCLEYFKKGEKSHVLKGPSLLLFLVFQVKTLLFLG